MTTIIDGKQHASRLREAIGQEVLDLHERHGIRPGLAVVLVGDDPASQVYVRNKAKMAGEAGIASFEHRLGADTTQSALLELIAALNADPLVHGILVQLPLPPGLSEDAVIQAISPDKDVDGFHPINIGNLATGARTMVPCTPLGCLMLLRQQLGELSGKRALVLGRSNIVGKPMANLLLRENCTVTVAHSRTRELAEECRRADIVIAAVGRPGLVTGEWLKAGATVIDVGINRIEEQGRSRLVGDVDFASASQVAGAITPVPGGVGPMTIACLLLNTLQATCHQHRLPFDEDIAQRAFATELTD